MAGVSWFHSVYFNVVHFTCVELAGVAVGRGKGEKPVWYRVCVTLCAKALNSVVYVEAPSEEDLSGTIVPSRISEIRPLALTRSADYGPGCWNYQFLSKSPRLMRRDMPKMPAITEAFSPQLLLKTNATSYH